MKTFKAWDKKNRKMVSEMSLWNIWEDGQDMDCNSSSYFLDERAKYPGTVVREDWIFLQGSGMRDRDGREIFEGDIIEYTVSGITYKQECPELNKWHFWQETEDNPTVKAIGNVYEHAHLLK